MGHGAVRVVIFLLIAIGALGPALTCVDPWDAFPDTGDNLIIFLAIASLCLGAASCLAVWAFALLVLLVAGSHTPLLPSSLCKIEHNLSLIWTGLRPLQTLRI